MFEPELNPVVRTKFTNLSFALIFAATLLAAPLYVWRFSVHLGGRELPTNFLMLFLFAVMAVGIVQILRENQFQKLKESILSLEKPLIVAIGLFGLASVISLFVFGISADKIAQWVVLYLQPLSIFVLIRYFAQSGGIDEKILEYFKIAGYVIVGTAGVLAFLQYFTLQTLPGAWQGNNVEPKRAIAFFAHPNAFSLFVTPIIAWLIPDVILKLRQINLKVFNFEQFKVNAKNWILILLWVLGGVGILLSLSRGAWLGLVAAFGVYVLINANKKLLFGFLGALVVIAGIFAIVPNLRYRVLLPFHGEKSSVARFSLWDTGTAMLRDNPILGKGVNGFKNNWDKYNKDTGLEHYNFPHNIFLNFWIDSGLLGLLSMLGILVLSAARGVASRANTSKKGLATVGLLLFVVAMTVHGLIDIPYFKNDLALVFWMVLAISA